MGLLWKVLGGVAVFTFGVELGRRNKDPWGKIDSMVQGGYDAVTGTIARVIAGNKSAK